VAVNVALVTAQVRSLLFTKAATGGVVLAFTVTLASAVQPFVVLVTVTE
jgi:hypothetical protein